MGKNKKVPVFLWICALLGVAILWYSERLGPGIGGDATIYITSARNLLNGQGLGLITAAGEFRLLPYFPPFFPLVLAFLGFLGANLVGVAGWLNILLFGLTIWLSGYLVFQSSGNALLSLLTSLLVLVSPVLIPAFSWAMSEPLAIFLFLAGMAVLLGYIHGSQKMWILIASAILLGFSFLTRYSMAACIGVGLFGILLFSPGARIKRILNSVLFFLVSILPVGVWIVYDLSRTATVSSRSIEGASGMASRLVGFWPSLREVLLFWLVPDSWITTPPYPAVLNHILVIGFILIFTGWVGILGWKIFKSRSENIPDEQVRLAFLMMLFVFAYLAEVAIIYVSTYPPITIATRMFSPMQVVVIILTASLVDLTIKKFPARRWMSGVIIVLLVGLTAWWGWRSIRIVQQNRALGMGFNSLSWQQSEVIQAVMKIPPETRIVSNEEMAVYYLTGRSSYPLAEIYRDRPLETLLRYGDGDLSSDEAQQVFRQQGAALILFNSLPAQLVPIYEGRTSERVKSLTEGLRQSFHGTDGDIYFYPEP